MATRRKIVRSTPKGQVTLPAKVRQQLRIDPDTLLDVSVRQGSIVLTPIQTGRAPGRIYADEEIAGFLRDDVLSEDDAAFFKKVLGSDA